jgi:hypothetical protein
MSEAKVLLITDKGRSGMEIPSAIGLINKQLNELDDVVRSLNKIVNPILTPAKTDDCGIGDALKRVEVSDLAQALYHIADRVGYSVVNVRGMVKRSEI